MGGHGLGGEVLRAALAVGAAWLCKGSEGLGECVKGSRVAQWRQHCCCFSCRCFLRATAAHACTVAGPFAISHTVNPARQTEFCTAQLHTFLYNKFCTAQLHSFCCTARLPCIPGLRRARCASTYRSAQAAAQRHQHSAVACLPCPPSKTPTHR